MQKIKTGDTVEVIAGKDLGERGEVMAMLPKKDRVVVDKINMMKRHRKARQLGGQQIPAQIVDFSAPLHISNVMLVCPVCDQKTRVGIRTQDTAKKVRFCKKCNAELK
ncbi:MAG: 50S ribosomal protein L24 [Armatimonadetes bacterium]|nr:50S ribosomal protein L24 [Anaerolineae bacterium]